jgi:hypothetical protein
MPDAIQEDRGCRPATIDAAKVSIAATTKAAAASNEAALRLPQYSESTPATVGPIIWPRPKLAVVSPIAHWARSPLKAHARQATPEPSIP